MSAGKLKNIILLVLLVTNLFLLGQVLVYERRSAEHHEAVIADTIAILADSGISIAREVFPDGQTPAAQSFTRARAAEDSLARALLGEDAVEGAAQGDYHAATGRLRLSGDGLLAAELEPGALPLGEEEPGLHALRLLERLGIRGEVTEVLVQGGITAVTVRQAVGGWPVFSCAVRCTYTDGSLVALSGRRVAGTPVDDEGEALSVATLLVRFRNAIRARGDVCSTVLSLQPGYELVSAFAGSSRLVPTLAIHVDGNRQYFINMKTGELRTP